MVTRVGSVKGDSLDDWGRRRDGTTVGHLSGAFRQQLRWLAAGLALGFLVPFVFADLLEVSRDLYYAIYAVAVCAFFAAWLRATDERLGDMVRRHWIAAVVLGVVCAGVMAVIAVRTEDATPTPRRAGAGWGGDVAGRRLRRC
jgi:hypothetical protein